VQQGKVWSRDLVIPLFRAQTEHAIGQSYPAETAKDHRSSGDAQSPPQAGVSADEDSRDSETDPQRYAQGTIHPPHIQKRCHIFSV
jgi:hypothetical protein